MFICLVKEIDALFGPGYQLTKVKDLSQPGQFVCKERITVAGPKGLFQMWLFYT